MQKLIVILFTILSIPMLSLAQEPETKPGVYISRIINQTGLALERWSDPPASREMDIPYPGARTILPTSDFPIIVPREFNQDRETLKLFEVPPVNTGMKMYLQQPPLVHFIRLYLRRRFGSDESSSLTAASGITEVKLTPYLDLTRHAVTGVLTLNRGFLRPDVSDAQRLEFSITHAPDEVHEAMRLGQASPEIPYEE